MSKLKDCRCGHCTSLFLCLQVPHVYGTKDDILKIIRSVFMNQITWQLTKIVGSLDLVSMDIKSGRMH